MVFAPRRRAALYLRKGLAEHGFVVDLATTAGEAVELVRGSRYDLVLIQASPSGPESADLLGEVRRSDASTPVLFLSAAEALDERVRFLDLGADDYVLEPFTFAELLARVQTVLRRTSARAPTLVKVADLEIDVVQRRCVRGGRRIDLTAKEFAILSLLARRSGEAISRTILAEQVWEMRFDTGSNFLEVHVRRLRAKVDEPFGAKLIHTVRGVGYVLEDRTEPDPVPPGRAVKPT